MEALQKIKLAALIDLLAVKTEQYYGQLASDGVTEETEKLKAFIRLVQFEIDNRKTKEKNSLKVGNARH